MLFLLEGLQLRDNVLKFLLDSDRVEEWGW